MLLRAARIAAAVAMLTACQSPAVVPSGLDDSDVAALTALDDAALEALETRDWQTYGSLVTDDVRWMIPGGPTMIGWSEIGTAATQLTPLNGMTYSNRRFSGSGDLAYRTVDYVSLPLADVERIDFRMDRGQAATRGAWTGALIGGTLGALLGLLAESAGSSCSPQPCSPPEVEAGTGVALGAIVFGALGAASGALIGVANGGRVSFMLSY